MSLWERAQLQASGTPEEQLAARQKERNAFKVALIPIPVGFVLGFLIGWIVFAPEELVGAIPPGTRSSQLSQPVLALVYGACGAAIGALSGLLAGLWIYLRSTD